MIYRQQETHTHVNKHVYIHLYTHVHTRVHTCIFMNMQATTHEHTYMHIYTQMEPKGLKYRSLLGKAATMGAQERDTGAVYKDKSQPCPSLQGQTKFS